MKSDICPQKPDFFSGCTIREEALVEMAANVSSGGGGSNGGGSACNSNSTGNSSEDIHDSEAATGALFTSFGRGAWGPRKTCRYTLLQCTYCRLIHKPSLLCAIGVPIHRLHKLAVTRRPPMCRPADVPGGAADSPGPKWYGMCYGMIVVSYTTFDCFSPPV